MSLYPSLSPSKRKNYIQSGNFCLDNDHPNSWSCSKTFNGTLTSRTTKNLNQPFNIYQVLFPILPVTVFSITRQFFFVSKMFYSFAYTIPSPWNTLTPIPSYLNTLIVLHFFTPPQSITLFPLNQISFSNFSYLWILIIFYLHSSHDILYIPLSIIFSSISPTWNGNLLGALYP